MSNTSTGILYYNIFSIKTGFSVPRSKVLRLEHPTAMRDPRHKRCVPACIFFRTFGVRLKSREGK